MRVGTSRGEGQTGAGVHFEYTFNSRVADASCSATEPILHRPDGSARVVVTHLCCRTQLAITVRLSRLARVRPKRGVQLPYNYWSVYPYRRGRALERSCPTRI
jgi:hypothetical protein